ncbi:MAG TPA: outer membrane lipid asymmetry maintenance protein MlaD [Mariprofundaceae bacterium]|nr:outer membrane lipid asymmetry maintenance protein MlaD [Mariprofundaceae bacterium]
MGSYKRIEMTVGVFVFLGLLSLGWMALELGKVGGLGQSGYVVTATFRDIGGVRSGSDIMMAGVQIGRVDDVELIKNSKALARLRINDGVKITDDAFASVRTKGIIGDRYIRVTQGISDSYLKPGDEFEETEDAINIEDLVSKYIFSGKQ